jgi:exosortase N
MMARMPKSLLFTLIPLTAALPWVWSYLQPGLALALTLMVTPFVWSVGKGKPRLRYGWLALVAWLFHVFLGNYLWLWLALGAAVFFAIEGSGKRVGWLPLCWLGLLSPVVGSWVQTFSFPLRLGLSQAVGESLAWLGAEVEVAGNRFYFGGQWFEVEAACLGLSTLTLAWVATVLLLGMAESQRTRRWALWQIAGWMLIATALAIVANYIRTLWLVLFHSPAETLGHELIGLMAIATWVVLPLLGMLRLSQRQSASAVTLEEAPSVAWEACPQPSGASRQRVQVMRSLPIGLITLVSLTSLWTYDHPKSSIIPAMGQFDISGMQRDQPQLDVLRFHDESMLVYLKAPTAAWRADHNPEVCWRGSGYRFAHIQETTIGGRLAMQAWLIQAGDTLHTAWGYHNGTVAVRGAWAWRWRQLCGERPFCLWNVTAADDKTLRIGVEKLEKESLERGF